LTFTSINKSYDKKMGHRSAVIQTLDSILPSTEGLGFYVCSVSSPALAHGQYVDR